MNQRLLLALLFVFWSLPAWAQLAPVSQSNPKIVEIRFDGIELIETGLLYNTISSSVNYPLSRPQVAQDIKDLFRLGYFDDVKAELEQVGPGEAVLVFRCVEKPRISKLAVIGQTKLDKKTLIEKLKVHENNMFNEARIQADLDLIKEEYRKKGYLKTQVRYERRDAGPGQVEVDYLVEETPKVYLTQFHVTGTKYFYPLDVERFMSSAEVDCFSWITDSGVFQEQKINQDLGLITQQYLINGFIKVHIDKPKVVLTQKRDLSVIGVSLAITEGEQYWTGKIDIVTDDDTQLLADKKEMIEKTFNLQEGEVFNPFKQSQDRFALNDVYTEQGYAFARVRPETNIHEDTKIVDVTYHIIRGEKAYIGRVEIEGNFETKDSVVRRELEIHDNELFDGLKLRNSKEAITKLGFFEQGFGVDFQQEPGEVENEIDYTIKLDEAQTGSFNASMSYSAYSGMVLSLSISKRNLFGTGKSVSFTAERRQRGENLFKVNLTNPYWFDTEFTVDTAVYSELLADTYYDTKGQGFYWGMGYPLWKDWNGNIRYSYRDELYQNIQANGSAILGGIEAQTYRSLRLAASYSTVNHPMFPSSGQSGTLSTERFGGVLGGSTAYQELRLDTKYFRPFNDDNTVIFMANYRQSRLMQTEPGKEIPAAQRYYIGGITTVRGHEWGDISGPSGYNERPIDFSTSDLTTEELSYYNQHQRGVDQRILNLEMLFPLTREGTNLRGVVFFDAGNVWSEDRMYEMVGLTKDPYYMRTAYGTGVRMITPMGVFRFEYGIKLDKKPQESPGRFDFHISGLF
ncbi:MAG: outer membrane protein assembly factor BamA [bacterium]|nr:outer membrane protein assembly factor BamA [bacterium]